MVLPVRCMATASTCQRFRQFGASDNGLVLTDRKERIEPLGFMGETYDSIQEAHGDFRVKRMCEPCHRLVRVTLDGDFYDHSCRRIITCSRCPRQLQYKDSYQTCGERRCYKCAMKGMSV